MDESDVRLRDVLARLEKLERENRRLKRIGSLAALIAVSLLSMGQAKSDRIIEAQKFVLKDGTGRIGGELSMGRAGATLTLNAPNGSPIPAVSLIGSGVPSLHLTAGAKSIDMTASEDRVMLGLYGEHSGRYGGIRAGLSIVNDIPALSLYDKDQRERVTVEANESAPSLILRDTRENEIVRVGFDPLSSSPTVSLMEEGGTVAASLSLNDDGPNLWLWDKERYSAILGSTGLVTPRTGEAHQTSAASLVLFDKDKNVIWKAP